AAGLLTGLAVFMAGAHFWVRPHLFTWAAALLVVALLRTARRRPARLLVLLPFQVIWTNLHGGFVLGPAIILGWAAGEEIRRRQGKAGAHPGRVAMTGLLSAAACLINPYGWSLIRLPFQLTGSELFMQAIFEWQSPFQSAYLTTTMFAGFLLMVVLLIWTVVRAWDRWDPCDLAVLGLALLLAVRMSRNVPLFALLAAGPLAACLGGTGMGKRAARWQFNAAAGILLATALGLALEGYPYSPGHLRPRGVGPGPSVPVAACDFIESHKLSGRAFTTYGEGAYVVWRLWPRVLVGMDSRNSVYGEDLYGEYRQTLRDPAATRRYLDRWQPDLAIIGHWGPFRRGWDKERDRDLDLPHKVFAEPGRMLLVDFDDLTAVYATPRACQMSGIEVSAYEVIHPVLLPAVFPVSSLGRALEEGKRAVQAHPESVLAHWILAKAYAQSNRPGEALEQLGQISRLDKTRMRRWGLAGSMRAARLGLTGLMQLKEGHCQAARQALEEALKADPDYGPARDLLANLDC
ncbi:MAG: hypothetical protein ACE5ID_10090, partial [Acidobacteriota bacterium]